MGDIDLRCAAVKGWYLTMSGNVMLPVLMRPGEIISLKEAAFRSGKNEKTIRRWCKEDGIRRRAAPRAPWEISTLALEAKRYGDEAALNALRAGDFQSPAVVRYACLLGLAA